MPPEVPDEDNAAPAAPPMIALRRLFDLDLPDA